MVSGCKIINQRPHAVENAYKKGHWIGVIGVATWVVIGWADTYNLHVIGGIAITKCAGH